MYAREATSQIQSKFRKFVARCWYSTAFKVKRVNLRENEKRKKNLVSLVSSSSLLLLLLGLYCGLFVREKNKFFPRETTIKVYTTV
jgi:hypothetical protein